MNRREMLKAALATLGVIVVGPPRLLERNWCPTIFGVDVAHSRDPVDAAVAAISETTWPTGIKVLICGVHTIRFPVEWDDVDGVYQPVAWGDTFDALLVQAKAPSKDNGFPVHSWAEIDVAGLRLSHDPGKSAVAEVWMHVEAVQQKLLPDVGHPAP